MKLTTVLVLVVILLALSTLAVSAAGPEPWAYSCVRTGLSIGQVWNGFFLFSQDYGWAHQLKTDEQWQSTYEARVNEYAAFIGCSRPLRDGALTPAASTYAPVFQRIITLYPD